MLILVDQVNKSQLSKAAPKISKFLHYLILNLSIEPEFETGILTVENLTIYEKVNCGQNWPLTSYKHTGMNKTDLLLIGSVKRELSAK